MMKVKGSIFLHFSILSHLSCSCSPSADWLQKACVHLCVCASVYFSPMVERQPKCEKDGCQSPFLSPKAPCLSSAGLVCTCIL